VKYFGQEKSFQQTKILKSTDLIHWIDLIFGCITKLENEQFSFADRVAADTKMGVQNKQQFLH
jgi:hypothetical protein